MAARGVNDEPRRLVDDQQVLVLEAHVEHDAFVRVGLAQLRRTRFDLDCVARAH